MSTGESASVTMVPVGRSGPPRAPEAVQAKSSVARDLVLVLVAGVLGVAGAYIGAHAVVATQREQSDETRAAEARVKRARVYTRYLREATRYRSALEVLYDDPLRCEERGAANAKCYLGREQRAAVNMWSNAQVRVRDARNQVLIYGSDRAVSAADRIGRALPGVLDDRYGIPRREVIGSEVFRSAYDGFVRLMCLELSAEPRSHC